MFSQNAVMATLAALVVFLLTTNALDISSEIIIDDVQEANYTIGNNSVVLHTVIGDIDIPMPEEVKAELTRRNEDKRSEKLTLYNHNGNMGNGHSDAANDFFECSEQAQFALSVHSEHYRYWEAFFKRNSISDTVAVSIFNLII